ncbi:DUF3723 domain containing protein [Pyrenophora tritici-repentis]|nr:DUF3723 domain containing protein [Pyrenophora tritici-repentis]
MLPFSAVDAVTVQSLELLAPKHSDIDKSLVIDLMERGKIFPSQNDRGLRKTLSADFGLPTATHVLVQDGMDIDIPPELPNRDAQHAELQLRYATLQQEYQNLSNQHETLVSKSDTQYETVNHLEVQNAEMKGLLEKYTTEYRQLNDTYYCVMQEHEACQKVKEQLQVLAHRWKTQSEENMKLNSMCTKLRRELKMDLENRTPDKLLPIVEEVQAPIAVEATTMSNMESSDDEPISDDLIPYTWTAGPDDRNQYEIFLVYAITEECELQGYGFDISQSIDEAIPQITDSLRQAETAFGSDQLHAITILGIHLINTEPAYLFGYLEANRTIFIGRNSVLASFVPALNAEASSSQPHHSVVTMRKSIYPLCGRSFSNLAALQQHERDSPGHTKCFNCKGCNRSFGSEEALAQHLRDLPGHTKCFNCKGCNRSFGSEEALAQHLRDLPGHAKCFNCKGCNRSFGSGEALAQHLRDLPAHEKSFKDMNTLHSQPSASVTRIGAPKPQSTFSDTSYGSRLFPARSPATVEYKFPTPNNEGRGSSSTRFSRAPTADRSEYFGEDSLVSFQGDLDDINFLISNDSEDDDTGDSQINEWTTQIRHAPLVSADVIFRDTQHILPQYGLMGLHDEAKDTRSKLFLNTNIPFSIFLCGVQGSGKSHTTSCILENSLVSSKHLGKLENPLSALVFSYGHFNGDGIGFSISEAAFLASPEAGVPGAAHVKKVHVLVSPSNYVRISKLYLRLPNVSVTPFRIKPQNLDITTMLTLMNVNESEETPLYMAQVTQILQEMSTAGGPFHYETFKLHLKKQKFNPTQTNMLQMRLSLLESFLDMKNTFSETQFLPGEIVIMDMSCPFVDANTACVLFKIGL